MVRLAAVSARLMAQHLGVPENICAIIRTAILRRSPYTDIRQSNDRTWVSLELPYGYRLDITTEGRDLVLSGHDGGVPGCQYFYYILTDVRRGEGHAKLHGASDVEVIYRGRFAHEATRRTWGTLLRNQQDASSPPGQTRATSANGGAPAKTTLSVASAYK